MDKIKRMKEISELLRAYSKAYYQENKELVSNKEYDALYDELEYLETKTGVILSNSPTQVVGYEIISGLDKHKHQYPMLSLDKTKSIEGLQRLLNKNIGILSYKLDGLTVVAEYEDGKLLRATTRGNGLIGEDITHNFKQFKDVPLSIDVKDHIIVRGEAVIDHDTFKRINSNMEVPYKNTRNLVSGTVRQLNSEVVRDRSVRFLTFSVVQGLNHIKYHSEQLSALESLGFEIVPNRQVNSTTLSDDVSEMTREVETSNLSADGLVLLIDDIALGKSLGSTSKFPRNAIAYKWADETAETQLTDVTWQISRTGTLTPVAVFNSVELDGTEVKKANLHNVSIVKELKLGLGDTILVYKANMIIPQVHSNITQSHSLNVPTKCPYCEAKTTISVSDNGIENLVCTNRLCDGVLVKQIEHYASRNAMNIQGFSEKTITRLVNVGLLKSVDDIYSLCKHKDIIANMNGFTEVSYRKMIDSINNSSADVELNRFIYALGFNGLGNQTSLLLAQHFNYNLDDILNASLTEIMNVDGIGEVSANSIHCELQQHKDAIISLSKHISFSKPRERLGKLNELTFVVTGKVYQYKNRKELESEIKFMGGKVSSSVSKNTDYLINNDSASSSSKNKKAKELGIPIISEAQFLEMIR